ncbi:uncharacterized protein METZ01_LOCUS57908 [marine metagenome]|uniref:START domain-containing protein n=1 Tax=marine metagenome TaxID=408172 RepID=A0A381SNQ4_9ZZZZ
MKLKFISSVLCIILNYGFADRLVVPDHLHDWNVLQDSDVWVGWTIKDDIQWCRSEKILPFEMEHISHIIEDKENYPNVFKRIEDTAILAPDIVHITLDMPFPFAGRDYIVKYVSNKTATENTYTFTAYDEIKVPERKNYVRLINAGGRWTVIPHGNGKTKVTYTWHGELRGDFPDWALERAWKVQGTEVLNWLYEALK